VLNSLKPFSEVVQLHLTDIDKKENALKELATMATMDGIKGKCIMACIRTSAPDHIILLDVRQKINAVGEIRELLVQISDKEALSWLNAIGPDSAYNFNKDRRLEGTCEWIFKTKTYQEWMNGIEYRGLWVVGIPGNRFPSF
jgi:hypothetical protein